MWPPAPLPHGPRLGHHVHRTTVLFTLDPSPSPQSQYPLPTTHYPLGATTHYLAPVPARHYQIPIPSPCFPTHCHLIIPMIRMIATPFDIFIVLPIRRFIELLLPLVVNQWIKNIRSFHYFQEWKSPMFLERKASPRSWRCDVGQFPPRKKSQPLRDLKRKSNNESYLWHPILARSSATALHHPPCAACHVLRDLSGIAWLHDSRD